MPRRIVTEDGSRFWITEYELPTLEANEVQIKVQLAAPKHGTEAQLISGSAFSAKQWHPELRLFLPRPESKETPAVAPVPRGIGNMIVGEVITIGSAVTRFTVGERVFGYGQVCELLNIPEDKLFPLGALTESDAVCCDPAHVAFVAVRDGNIRVGDDVAVFGLGAIGLLAVQIAKAGGARRVFAVDPLALRREHALAHGATEVFDPLTCDTALQIKLATKKLGVDVSIETSGNGKALNDAIRCVRQCGTVVHVPWGPKDASALKLGGEIRDVTVMFVDIENFTPLGEKLKPEELVRVINELLDACSKAILAEQGTIDKYIGDGVMAFWNAPVKIAEHQYRAARAALGIRIAVAALPGFGDG